jgi:precorrin-4/cobalt-precorrin-4 C11-methyltransferase
MMQKSPGKVMFVGAGPGDPKLITCKGKELLEQADVVIWAGSLVNPALLDYCRKDTVIHDSAGMTLPEVLAVMDEATAQGKQVVRLHTGDPSIYGAIQEQMDHLRQQGIAYEVVPGVSSFLAAAASLKQEYTLPGVSQTVIVTRLEGRTPVPVKEALASLASHQSNMCIFLSTHLLAEVVAELKKGGYAGNTPIVVAQKVSWPDEKIIRGTLDDIVDQVQAADIYKTALIIVSHSLDSAYELSQLYSPQFSHEFRQAK